MSKRRPDITKAKILLGWEPRVTGQSIWARLSLCNRRLMPH